MRELVLRTVQDYTSLFEQRASGACAALFPDRDPDFRKRQDDGPSRRGSDHVFCVWCDDPWFRELSSFDREYVVFRLFFTPWLPGFSDATFDRLLLSAATRRLDHRDFDGDDEVAESRKFLLDFKKRVGRRWGQLPSLADLDPVLFRMASHHLRVAGAFKKTLATKWSGAKLEKVVSRFESHGPLGAAVLDRAKSELAAHEGFLALLRAETAGYHGNIAAQACQRLASQQFAMALDRHRARPAAALTLRGLQRTLFTRLATDLIRIDDSKSKNKSKSKSKSKSMSKSEATRRAGKLLAHVLGAPYLGAINDDEIKRFARQSLHRWVRKGTRG